MPDGLVTASGQFGFGEAFAGRLELLQAGDVGPGLIEPLQQRRQAAADAVDIESGDPHARSINLDQAAIVT